MERIRQKLRRRWVRILLLSAVAAVLLFGALDAKVLGYVVSSLRYQGRQWLASPATGVPPSQVVSAAFDEANRELTLLAAGDIAICSDGDLSENAAAKTAMLAEDWRVDPVLALGDLAYGSGTPSDFANCFDPLWGGLKSRVLPTPGNHEYETLGAYGYFDYWGEQAGPSRRGYYSTKTGNWLIVSLNSEVAAGPNSEQGRWLEETLTKAPDVCILAFFHKPAHSLRARRGSANAVRLFAQLQEAGVSLVLNGHNHFYERTRPLNADGELDDRDGTMAFTVGTGGRDTSETYDVLEETAKAIFGHRGLLRLELRDDDYSWWFHDAETKAVLDAGTAVCNPRTSAS